MKQSQFRNVIVSGMLACALLVAIALRHGSPPPVYDESGERLESLFAGIAPDAEVKEAVLRDGASSGGSLAPCQSTSPLVRHLAGWINPPVASAYSCSAGCGGHHMYYQSRPCPTGCNTIDTHNLFYVSPNRAPWHLGRQDVGGLSCRECGPCAQMTCENWY